MAYRLADGRPPRRPARESAPGIPLPGYTYNMAELIPKLLVAGLGAAVSPVAIMVIITLMLMKHPLKNAAFFLVGFAPTLLALGITAGYFLHLGGSGKKSAVDGYIDIALGVLCILAAVAVFLKKPKEKKAGEQDISAPRAVLIGCVTMLTNYSTLVIYVSGIHVISSARLGASESALAVAFLSLITLSTVLAPIIIYIAFPRAAERVLTALKSWLSRHNKQIGIAILAVFAVVLIVKGVMAF